MKNRNRIIIVLSLVFIVLALGFMVLGFALAGADIIAWFSSKWAIWLYVFLGVYAIVVISMIVFERIKRL